MLFSFIKQLTNYFVTFLLLASIESVIMFSTLGGLFVLFFLFDAA